MLILAKIDNENRMSVDGIAYLANLKLSKIKN